MKKLMSIILIALLLVTGALTTHAAPQLNPISVISKTATSVKLQINLSGVTTDSETVPSDMLLYQDDILIDERYDSPFYTYDVTGLAIDKNYRFTIKGVENGNYSYSVKVPIGNPPAIDSGVMIAINGNINTPESVVVNLDQTKYSPTANVKIYVNDNEVTNAFYGIISTKLYGNEPEYNDPSYTGDYEISGLEANTTYNVEVVIDGIAGSDITTITTQIAPPIISEPTGGTLPNDSYSRTSAWDLVGTDTVMAVGQGWGYWRADNNTIAQSTGGNFKVTFFTPTESIASQNEPFGTAKFSVQLWEDDGSSGTQLVKTLGYIYLNGKTQSLIISDISKWKDGSNNRAEFFIKVRGYNLSVSNTMTFKYYD